MSEQPREIPRYSVTPGSSAIGTLHVLSDLKLPINWKWTARPGSSDEYQAKGMSLTRIANLPGGLVQLDKIRKWCTGKDRVAWLAKAVGEQLDKPGVREALAKQLTEHRGAQSKYYRRKATAKSNAAVTDREMKDRQLEFGGGR